MWSAGCASGEEAYSAAIIIAEHFGSKLADYDVKIYATDIDDDALNTARRAEYAAKLLRRVPPELRAKYFTGDKVMRVNRDVRRLVIFGKSNLAFDAPISHVKLLICRNALIYFDTATQERIMARLHYVLDPGGILFLGAMGAEIGIPFMANDAAAKAYVHSFAKALHVELKPLGVHVTVLPAGVRFSG